MFWTILMEISLESAWFAVRISSWKFAIQQLTICPKNLPVAYIWSTLVYKYAIQCTQKNLKIFNIDLHQFGIGWKMQKTTSNKCINEDFIWILWHTWQILSIVKLLGIQLKSIKECNRTQVLLVKHLISTVMLLLWQ